MQKAWALFIVFPLLVLSCKKNESIRETVPPTPETTSDLLMDSVYLYSKEVYFWNDRIPSYNQFNPRQYRAGTALSSAINVMNAIRALQASDRYSFVTTREESEGIQSGQNRDFGFFVKSFAEDLVAPADSIAWYVSYVYDQSTAGLAGVKRGWKINKVNGTGLSYNQASIDLLNNTFFGNNTTASFEFVKPDKSVVTHSLNKTAFQSNSVLYQNVFVNGAHKTGYLVFNQFFGQPSRKELGEAFTYFQSEGINELVIDLRYNPGGSTETQDTLANLVAPLTANNKRMYTYEFNQQLKNGNFPLLKTKPGFAGVSFSEAVNSVNYQKAGNLNLSRVFFIVTGSSASASELIINNLKPYMDVKVIGDTTYGKPVGFFPINIADYAIYPVSFRTINSAGNADYYAGFAPDRRTIDGVNKGWGDVTEPSLAAALRYIQTGSFGPETGGRSAIEKTDAQQKIREGQQLLEKNRFTGMFRE
jgi:carboxyl-terminal processing protease